MFRKFLSWAIHANTQQQSKTIAWSDRLFVNHLKLPKIYGPTAEEITSGVDLTNKTCLITGGTSGIGAEIVRCLMAKNCDIAMACRNPYAASILAKNIWGDQTNLKIYETNLASFASVKKATQEILEHEPKIDIVILNAAVFGIPWTLTEDGFETSFQVNFLSQFYMLTYLESILAPDARVIIMSSDSHRFLKWSIQDTIEPTKELVSLPKEAYTSIKAYNISKLCGIFAMHYFGFKWSKTGRTILCANPGSFIKTQLCRNWWVYESLYTMMYPFTKSIAQAAAVPVYCATSSELQGVSDAYIKNFKQSEVSDLAHDNLLAFRIMDLSHSFFKYYIDLEEELVIEDVKKVDHEELIEEKKSETAKSSIEEPVLSS